MQRAVLLLLMFPVVLAHEDTAFSAALQHKQFTALWIIGAITIALVAALLFRISVRKPDNPWGSINGIILIVLGAALVYGGYAYFLSSAEEITFCEDDRCFWSANIQADLLVSLCGNVLDLGQEKGSEQGTHIHQQREVHFHDQLPWDPEAKRVTNWDNLRIQQLFDSFGIRLADSCLADKCNGDYCGEKPGTLTMSVNGVLKPEMGNYVWQNGDQMVIRFE